MLLYNLGIVLKRLRDNMSNSSLVAVANASAVGGTATGFWSVLSQNQSEITTIVIVATLVVTLVAHIFDKVIKIKSYKLESKSKINEMIKNDIDSKRLELENKRLELEHKIKIKELEILQSTSKV